MSNYFEAMSKPKLQAQDLVKKRKLPKVESYQGVKRDAPSYFDHASQLPIGPVKEKGHVR